MKLLLCFAFVVLASAKVRYDGYKVLKLYPSSDEHIQAMRTMHEDLQLDFWTDTEVMVPPTYFADFEKMLNDMGLTFEVKIENVQEDIYDPEPHDRDPRNYDINNFLTYEEIVAFVETSVAACRTGCTCTKESLGSSYLGLDIPVFQMDCTQENKRTVYLDSLIHAREWLAGATVVKIIDNLINGNDEIINDYDWYIAPVVNPDGYNFTWNDTRLWRKNRQPNTDSACIGTDLNRNFDANWGWSGTSTNPCAETYGGASAASGVETALVQNQLNALNSSAIAVVSYHAYANMWLHAYGYTTTQGGTVCARADQYDSINAVAGAASNAVEAKGGERWVFGPVCNVIYPASGSTVDYAYDKANLIYAYTPELRGTSFTPPASEIQPSYEEQWAGLVAMLNEIERQHK